jgi:hypothetical protein
MSAYIVEDKTINRVVSYINSSLQREHSWLFNEFLRAAEVDRNDEDWTTKLGISMAMLNDKAMDARYGEGTAVSDREGVSYEFHWEMAAPIQVLKSLQCWHYQCSEGDIAQTSELYKVAEQLELYLATSIVSRLPQYDKAVWG